MTIPDPPVDSADHIGRLRPRARLLRTLGDELISSDKVALIELVKNSFDADATRVIIRFVGPHSQPGGRIEVWDDGQGMSVHTLQSSWLDIATDTKKLKPKSAKGRRLLGEKGIGRLAAARLGSEMLLVTREKQSSEVSLLIDWTDFDKEGAYLDEIEVGWEVGEPAVYSGSGEASRVFDLLPRDAAVEHGTLVRMDNSPHPWGREEVVELRTALARLIRPRPVTISVHDADITTDSREVTSDFEIYLDFVDVGDEIAELAGEIGSEELLRTPHYQISGVVDAQGVASLKYFQDEPPMVERLENVSLWGQAKSEPQTGPFEFEINVWDRDREALARVVERSLSSTPQSADIRTFRETLNAVSGISIYRDGFRVLPFGEAGDDWLRLDLRRVQSPTRRLSNNQIIGHIFIGADTNPGLRDQTNREGLQQGQPFEDLRTMVRAALTVAENKRYLSRPREYSQPETAGGLFGRFDLAELQQAVSASYPNEKRLISLLDEKNRSIQEGVAEVQNTLSRYSRLATLGSLVDRILHDGRTIVTRLKANNSFGLRDIAKQAVDCEERLTVASKWFNKSATQTELLSRLFNQIEPFGGRKRGRPKEISSFDVVEKAFAILEVEADERGVSLVNVGENVAFKVDESEILTVLINLVQNAIYWTSTQPKGVQREVRVDFRRTADDAVILRVADSGPGVPDEIRDAIFEPYFSSRAEGVGLGLSIAGNIVGDIYGGELLLVEDDKMNGAAFDAIFRRRT